VSDINNSGSLWLIRLSCRGLYVPVHLYSSCLGAWAMGSGQGAPLDRKDRQCTGVTLKSALVKNWCPTSTKVVVPGLLDYHVSDCMSFQCLYIGCMGRGKWPGRSVGPKGPPMYWRYAQNRSGEKLVPDINKSGSLWLIRLPCLGLYIPRVWVPGPWEAARALLWTKRTANVLVSRSKSLW
jgi:hypothetical protein